MYLSIYINTFKLHLGLFHLIVSPFVKTRDLKGLRVDLLCDKLYLFQTWINKYIMYLILSEIKYLSVPGIPHVFFLRTSI